MEPGKIQPPDAHATLVVVGPDNTESQYAFDAIIDDADGEMPVAAVSLCRF